jgi:dTDP-glucose 4,6-dehydratase
MSKNILVTGGAGFIGSSFVAQNVAIGNQVIIVDALTYAGHRENIEWIQPADKYELIVANINDKEKIYSLLIEHQIDVIVNFAAESPEIFIQTNVVGTYRLLEAAYSYYKNLTGQKKDNFRYIQISTDEVYGSLGENGKFHEQYLIQPNSPYSASKAAGDHFVRAWYETYGLPTIITNCSNNYGPRQHPEKLIPKTIINALQGKDIPIYGDGKNIRDWIHVEDHCRGINLAIEHGRVGETYCLGGNAERTNMQVVTEICNILDEIRPNSGKYTQQIKYVQDRLGHDRRYAIDDSKAVNELGFNRKYEFEQGLKASVSWYLDNTKWCNNITGTK